MADSIRYSIRTQTADSQVSKTHFSTHFNGLYFRNERAEQLWLLVTIWRCSMFSRIKRTMSDDDDADTTHMQSLID